MFSGTLGCMRTRELAGAQECARTGDLTDAQECAHTGELTGARECECTGELSSVYAFNGIIDRVTLLQFMDSIENINHAVSIFAKWIFDSNLKKVLPLMVKYLNLICSSSDGENIFTFFEECFLMSGSSTTKEKIRKSINSIFYYMEEKRTDFFNIVSKKKRMTKNIYH